MKKSIGVISQLPTMARYYADTLKSLFDDIADIYWFSLEDHSVRKIVECELYVNTCTSYEIMKDEWARKYFPKEDILVQAAVNFTCSAIDILRSYPEKTTAMLVNQNRHMAMECISQLYNLGITNIEFYPYAPEMGEVPDVDIAFSLGECELESPKIPVVDLGLRKLSVNTICEVAFKLGLTSFMESHRFKEYAQQMIDIDYSLKKISSENLTLVNKLEMIVDALDEGIICMDEAGKINLSNRTARMLLGKSRYQLLGQPIGKIIPELPVDKKTMGKSQLMNLKGVECDVTVIPLQMQENFLGFFAKIQQFEKEEQRQSRLRLQKTRKNHQAQYTFADIIGKSSSLQKVKEIALSVADSDASVMIEGESGTGKELFAQAIHNASLRKIHPFIAVNCAALTETLLESELFGYVDGAFTGARKGGKAGLFECAHQGTLFLDEIETMSPGLQAKLLRALQEREIVRIGSVETIPVDVRVISSTNENMYRRMQEGSFRRDLYYRLNVIPLHLPPLRERKEDIMLLVDNFCGSYGTCFTFKGQVEEALLQYKWPGNIRELHNFIEYLWNIKGSGEIKMNDLPEQLKWEMCGKDSDRMEDVKVEKEEEGLPEGFLRPEWQVLQILGKFYHSGKGVGRCILRPSAVANAF